MIGAGSLLSRAELWAETSDPWHMPDEGAPHQRTWMAFGPSKHIWGRRLLAPVQQDLALIARTIAQFEPVTLLTRPEELRFAMSLEPQADIVACPLDHLWIRDTGPTFVFNAKGQAGAIDFNFNGWGNKQSHKRDTKVAAFVAEYVGAQHLLTDLVLEGGCFEVDGEGSAIITESCSLNRNRNPGVSKAEFEAALKPLLGLEKIIWLPGIKGRDITDGHTDFYARFAGDGRVVVGLESDPDLYDYEITRDHIRRLKQETDAQGRKLEIIPLESPHRVNPDFDSKDFAAGYIGYYLCNGGLIMQAFGDEKRDAAAQHTLQDLFPDREVIALQVDGLAAGGGSIHCATQQQPRRP